MKCSVYIAATADGFIARKDGGIDWLETAGDPEKGVGEGYIDIETFIATVDCMIMGRKTIEAISGFNLTPEQWPYGDLKVIALSRSLKEPPDNLKGKVEMYSGDLPALLDRLEQEGHKSAYVDGGSTIQSFIKHGLISEIIVTQMPILIGEGQPLFGETQRDVRLSDPSVVVCPSGYFQLRYTVENEAASNA